MINGKTLYDGKLKTPITWTLKSNSWQLTAENYGKSYVVMDITDANIPV